MQGPTQFSPRCDADRERKAVFPLLADPANYVACKWDLTHNAQRRAYWLDLFRGHFPKCLREAMIDAADAHLDLDDARRRGQAAQSEFEAYLDHIAAHPGSFGRLTILEICYQRERALRHQGFDDPYRVAKRVETEQALTVLPSLLHELDQLPTTERQTTLICGVFAGNIFDLGATKTVDMFQTERVNFHETRGLLKPRPWYIDGLDRWLERLQGPAHRAAVLFVDNAGPDVVLGMLPFARDLIQRGTRVILTANPHPSLNDITHAELLDIIRTAATFDPVIRDAFAEGGLRLIPSGNWAPLIDLTQVSPELASAAASEPIDLVVIEGMGRAVESNLEAKLTCDCLKLAMVKDEGVADTLGEEFGGCELFDLVMKFEQAEGDFVK